MGKLLLVIAFFGAVQAESDPGFYYGVGTPHVPLVYTHHAAVAPVAYHAPAVYASNVCRNEGGAVVPCSEGTASGIYAFADVPHTYGFHGLVPAPAAAPAAAAPEEAVVSVEKREAEAEPEAEADAEADPWLLYSNYYGGHPGYYGHGYGLGYGYGAGYYGGYGGYYGHRAYGYGGY